MEGKKPLGRLLARTAQTTKLPDSEFPDPSPADPIDSVQVPTVLPVTNQATTLTIEEPVSPSFASPTDDAAQDSVLSLPDDWVARTSNKKGSTYYLNTKTHKTQWQHPAIAIQSPEPIKVKPPIKPAGPRAPPTAQQIAAALEKVALATPSPPINQRRHTHVHGPANKPLILSAPLEPLKNIVIPPNPCPEGTIVLGEWREHFSHSQQRTFWTSMKSGQKTWVRPVAQTASPDNISSTQPQASALSQYQSPYVVDQQGQWTIYYSPKFSRRFYKHEETQEMTWANPLIDSTMKAAEKEAGVWLVQNPEPQRQPLKEFVSPFKNAPPPKRKIKGDTGSTVESPVSREQSRQSGSHSPIEPPPPEEPVSTPIVEPTPTLSERVSIAAVPIDQILAPIPIVAIPDDSLPPIDTDPGPPSHHPSVHIPAPQTPDESDEPPPRDSTIIGPSGGFTGTATIIASNGDTYAGKWIDGKKCGNGAMTYAADKSVYDGEWKDDVWFGRGTLTNKTEKYLYDGMFAGGMKNGAGKCQYLNGDIYDGSYLDDRRHGDGKFRKCDDGTVYDGQWVDDVREGKGKCTFDSSGADGQKLYAVFEGEFSRDQIHGKGKFVDKNGSYEGQWVNNMKHGFGRTLGTKGEVLYEGEYRDNHRWLQGASLSTKAATGMAGALSGTGQPAATGSATVGSTINSATGAPAVPSAVLPIPSADSPPPLPPNRRASNLHLIAQSSPFAPSSSSK